MVNCTSRNAFRLLALAGVVAMTSAAGATPPSTTNVGTPDKPATGQSAPVSQEKAVARPSTSAKGARVSETKAGAPTASNRAPMLPKGSSWGPAEEGTRGVPSNDECANAIALNIGDVVFSDNIGAALDPAAPFCGTSNSIGGVWYTFVGDGSTLPITNCGAGTTFDSKIYVYTGTCDALVCVDGNDDTCGVQSQVTISTIAGETYYVLVGGYSGQGNFQLSIGTPPPPECATCPKGAEQEGEGQPCGIPADFFNGGCNSVPEAYSAIDCGDTICGTSAFDGGTRDTDWYLFNATVPTEITWSTLGANFDWQLFIIDLNAGCGGLLILSQAAGPACSTGSCSAIVGPGTYAMFMGTQFVGSYPCETDYTVQMTCAEAVLPENDECADAIALSIPSSTSGTTSGALPDAAIACGTTISAGGVWYTVQGTGTTITVSTCTGTTYDSKLNVYCGTGCDDLFCVTGIDDACGLQSQVSFCSVAGQTYWILVQGFGGAQGDFQLDISDDGFACEGAAACEPIIIECQKGDLIENEFESGNGCGVPVDFFNGGCNSVPEVYSTIECGQTVCGSGEFDGFTRDTDWYTLSVSGPTLVTWTMEESAFDWVLFIIDLSAGCGGLVISGAANGAAGVSGSAQAILGGAGTYALFASPNFTVPVGCPSGYRASVTCEKAVLPENDDCANAEALTVPSSVSGSTLGAQLDPQAFFCGGFSVDGGGVWYTVTGTGNTITASLCAGTFYDSKIHVYCGTGCDDLFCVASDDDFCGFAAASQVSFCSVAGQTYWIFISGFGGAQGDFQLDLSDDGFACEGAAACEPIIINCQKGDVIENEFESGNGCGVPADFFNGGCNSVPEIYSTIECGQTVCGSGEFDGFTRDTDWYMITVASATEFTWCMEESAFDWQLFIIDLNGGCGAIGIVGAANGLAGTTGCATGAVGPGTYVMFVAPSFTVPVGCPSGYRASLSCGEPCSVACDGIPEGEDDCGVPVDTFNGGCNSVPPVFSTVECNQTICGTGAFDGFTRDTDWYSFTTDTTCTITWTVASEFAWLGGYIEWQPGFEGAGDCAFITGFVNPFSFLPGDCQPNSITVTVGPGEHWFFVAPQFAATIGCGPGSRNNYTATLTADCCGKGADCNENGVPDSEDIANGTSEDCFDYSAAAGTAGGPNGIPDECECVADWNRDGIANSTDVSDFVNTFFADQVSGGLTGDVNCDGTSNSTDVSDFINIWFAAQAGQLPYAGCTI